MEQQLELVDFDTDDDVMIARTVEAPADTRYLVHRDGQVYAGTHLLIDVHEADGLSDIDRIDAALRDAVAAVGATLLHMELHHFNENDGISGVAILAESHVSIHTWPEINFAAIDIFICGSCDPFKAIAVFERVFASARISVAEHRRGIIS